MERFELLHQTIFSVLSIFNTTGFTLSHFNLWPGFLPYLMMTLALFGGCASSTSGGLKIVRLQVFVELFFYPNVFVL